jgi:tetratricopeptide (TPR) repeat protein
MNEEKAGKIQKHQTGWKKRVGLLVLLLVAAIGGFIWLTLPPREPAYQGHPLSYWLSRAAEYGPMYYDDSKDPKVIACREAIRHIGTNAIPSHLWILREKDSAFKMKVMDLIERQDFVHIPFTSIEEQKAKAQIGFYVLGDLASNAVPALIDIYAHPSSTYSKEIADSILMQLYPAPCVATPYWVPLSNRVQWYLVAGRRKVDSGAVSNALPAFSEAIKLAPTNTDAYLMRGDSKLQLQDFIGAILDFEKVMALSPSNEAAFYARGLCKYGLKDFKSAVADFTTALNLETNNVNAYNYRGLARANLRELDAALSDFNKAIELSPEESMAYRNRAQVEGLQKEFELALADASKAIKLDDHDAMAHIVRGRMKVALKDYQAALPDYDKAIELNPKDPTAYSARGLDRALMDDFDSAGTDLEKALQLDPKTATAFIARGFLKEKRGGQKDAALADFARAVELAPQIPETYGLLGLFEYKNSQWEPALANCRQALKLGALTSVSDLHSCIWLIRAQSGEEAAANQELDTYLKSLAGTKTNEWSAHTARFFTGSLSESNYLSLATTSAKRPSSVKSQVCESLYYAGMKRKLAGDKPGAVELFQKCLDTKDGNNFASMNAAIEMRALKQP